MCITGRLTLNCCDIFSGSGFLCFNNSDRTSIHKKGIVDRTGTCREFSHRNTERCG